MAKAEEITRESIAICFKKQDERKKKREMQKKERILENAQVRVKRMKQIRMSTVIK